MGSHQKLSVQAVSKAFAGLIGKNIGEAGKRETVVVPNLREKLVLQSSLAPVEDDEEGLTSFFNDF